MQTSLAKLFLATLVLDVYSRMVWASVDEAAQRGEQWSEVVSRSLFAPIEVVAGPAAASFLDPLLLCAVVYATLALLAYAGRVTLALPLPCIVAGVLLSRAPLCFTALALVWPPHLPFFPCIHALVILSCGSVVRASLVGSGGGWGTLATVCCMGLCAGLLWAPHALVATV